LTLGANFGGTDPRLGFQQFQLRVGEPFTAGPVFVNAEQAQALFQHPHLVLDEPEPFLRQAEPLLIEVERTVELLKKRPGQNVVKLTNQLEDSAFEGG
jgi:hypothetical protein